MISDALIKSFENDEDYLEPARAMFAALQDKEETDVEFDEVYNELDATLIDAIAATRMAELLNEYKEMVIDTVRMKDAESSNYYLQVADAIETVLIDAFDIPISELQ